MFPNLRNAVVVITGASSGIGRATAHAFARRGATLVLAARRREALESALHECEELGGRGIAVPTDVRDADQIEALCEAAVTSYDRIDVWVNNAAVTMFGRLEETPRRDYERVLDTNILGYVNGARSAIRQFREQGSGHLINISSVLGHAGQPYTSAYVTSKWANLGLSECLRMELVDAPGVRVSSVLPSSIDTPIFLDAANHTGRPVKPLTPIYPPEQVAEGIVRLVQLPRREVIVGNAGRLLALVRTLCPPLAERIMVYQMERNHFAEGLPVAPTSGNLFESEGGSGSATGGWRSRNGSSPIDPQQAGLALGLAMVAVPLGVLGYRQWQASRHRRRT